MGRRNRAIKSEERVEARRLDQEWRTAIYARLSMENNGLEDERSLDNQIRYVEEYIQKHPYLKLVDVYVDNGYSGTNFSRTQFLRLMDDLKTGRINCIVVKDLSRFGRNYLEAGYYLEKIFPFLNIRFIAINDNYDSMDESKKDSLIVPIKNLVNDIYSKDLSRKISGTMRMKEKKGEIWYGVPAYGYWRKADQPFRMETDEETAPYVRLVFQWTLSGMSYAEIAYRLNQLQAITPTMRLAQRGHYKEESIHLKKTWAVTSVKTILHNPVYMGDTIYNRSFQCVRDGTEHAKRPREKWFVIPKTHEALVSREDFEKVAQLLEKRNEAQAKKIEHNTEVRAKSPDILNGLFFCADCGRKMYYYRDIRKGKVKFCSYYCSGYRYGTREVSKCERIEIPDRLVRLLVLDQIRLQIQAGCRVMELKKLAAKSDKVESQKNVLKEQVKSLNQKMVALSAKRHRLYEDFADGILTEEDYKEIKSKYDGNFNRVSSELLAVEKQLSELQNIAKPDQDFQELVNRVGKADRLTYELVHEMVERIEFGREKVLHITFRHHDWVQELVEMEGNI